MFVKRRRSPWKMQKIWTQKWFGYFLAVMVICHEWTELQPRLWLRETSKAMRWSFTCFLKHSWCRPLSTLLSSSYCFLDYDSPVVHSILGKCFENWNRISILKKIHEYIPKCIWEAHNRNWNWPIEFILLQKYAPILHIKKM